MSKKKQELFIAKQVYDELQISAATLRKWSKDWPALQRPRDERGKQQYSASDKERMQALCDILKTKRIPLQEAQTLVERAVEKEKILLNLKAMKTQLQAWLTETKG